jgi:hypothetical protein
MAPRQVKACSRFAALRGSYSVVGDGARHPFVAGLALALLTLTDVTVVVPGGSKASLRVARRLVWMLLPLRKAARGKRHGLSGAFAPFVLVLCFVVWMAFLAFGFGLMSYAARADFRIVLAAGFCGLAVMTMAVTYLLEGPKQRCKT